MGLDLVIPLVILAVALPIGLGWAKRAFKSRLETHGDGDADRAPVSASGGRLTSSALRELPSPPWRVVYEIAPDKLGGVEHVLIGRSGVFAIQTSIDPLPPPLTDEPDARSVAEAAIARGDLDVALGRCAMSSDRLVRVHWGAPGDGTPTSIDLFPGLTVVDGRVLGEWAQDLSGGPTGELTAAQVDLAWQTVSTAIGRPDPLA